MTKKITKDIILILVTIAALVSFFWNPRNVELDFLWTLLGGIVGYYVGIKNLPLTNNYGRKKLPKSKQRNNN